MSSTCHRLALACVTALSLGACAAAKNPKDGPSFVQAAYTAFAAHRASCIGAPLDLVQAEVTIADFQGHIANSIKKKRLAYSGDEAALCVAQVAKTDCNALPISFFDFLGTNPSCLLALAGQVKVSGDCFDGNECVAGAWCSPTANCQGSCQAAAPLGAACDQNTACDVGTQCVRGLCRSLGGDGANCFGNEGARCAPGLYCAGGTTTTTGVCRAEKASGACADPNLCQNDPACVPQQECAAGYTCAAGDAALSTWACEAVHKEGEGCQPAHNHCALGLSCAKQADATYQCQRWGGAGAVCGIYDEEPILCAGAWCGLDPTNANLMGACQPLLDDDAGCQASLQCKNGPCDPSAGVCLPACPLQ